MAEGWLARAWARNGPGYMFLLPWLAPAWARDLRKRSATTLLLGGWILLVLLFFSLSDGKRSVYIFPAAPALALLAAPHLASITARPGARRVLAEVNANVQESITGIGVAKDFRQEQRIYDEFKPVNEVRKGLDRDVVAQISELKNEPDWMREFRQRALELFESKPMPKWGGKIDVKFSTCWTDRSGTHTVPVDKTGIDLFCVYCPDTDECYYLKPGEFGSNATLRVEAPKNRQAKLVKFASDYRRVP